MGGRGAARLGATTVDNLSGGGGASGIKKEATFEKTEKSVSGGGGGGSTGEVESGVKGVTFGGAVKIEDYGAKEQAYLRKMFGRNISETELSNLVGAPTGSTVTVVFNPDSPHKLKKFQIEVTHPHIEEMSRSIYRNDFDELAIKNSTFIAQNSAPEGFGTAVFARQVAHARASGVSYIKTSAVRWDSNDPNESLVGYYVWARLGYQGILSSTVKNQLRTDPRAFAFRNANSIHDVMRAGKAGREWWKKKGEDFTGIFSLDRGSPSMRVLGAYARKRGIPFTAPAKNKGRRRGKSFGHWDELKDAEWGSSL